MNKNIDYAIDKSDGVNGFVMQDVDNRFNYEQTLEMMKALFADKE